MSQNLFFYDTWKVYGLVNKTAHVCKKNNFKKPNMDEQNSFYFEA